MKTLAEYPARAISFREQVPARLMPLSVRGVGPDHLQPHRLRAGDQNIMTTTPTHIQRTRSSRPRRQEAGCYERRDSAGVCGRSWLSTPMVRSIRFMRPRSTVPGASSCMDQPASVPGGRLEIRSVQQWLHFTGL